MTRHDDATTRALPAFVDAVPSDSWYLIISETTAVGTRVVHLLDDAEIVFGRIAGADVVIDHESVSRRHARVRRSGDQIVVEDLGSRNGTLVNGQPIKRPTRVAAGDVVTVGRATAVVASASAARRARYIATIGELEERLEGEVDRAHRYHRPMSLVMLRLEGPEAAVAAHVERLTGELRRMDLLAEYGADEIALLLPETSATAAAIVADRAARAGAGITAHVGIASFPADGSSAGELLTAVRDRLRGSRTAVTGAKRRASTIAEALGRHIVVADAQMKHVFELAKRVASSPMTVLVTGETGAGKEAVAESIHRLSPRAAKDYVRLNCASLTETLVESELFGHEKGAFTGAHGTKAGFFEAASGGTLFLDEIGELPLGTQAKLLRVLEQRKIVRVGGTREIAIDTRLVCATHRDLEAEVKRGRFREDLYFRISAFVIPVPPLRDRRAEIALLAAQFARELSGELGDRIASLSPDAVAALSAFDWPGNVRELRNVIERAVVLSECKTIEVWHLPDRVVSRASSAAHAAADTRRREIDRDAVVAALQTNQGNQTHTARALGISRFALIRLLDKYGLRGEK